MIIGYIALGFSLLAMTFKNMLIMRIVHSLAAVGYIIYGLQIEATPIFIGGLLFLIIHLYHFLKIFNSKHDEQLKP
jgi:hypothetical protein